MRGRYKIYLLLTNTKTVFSSLINLYTKDVYNHSSLCLDKELKDVYSFGRKRVRNPLYAGFVKEDINKILTVFPDTQCLLYEIEINPVQYFKLINILNKFELNESYYTYNLLGVLGYVIDKEIGSDSSYYCSQFVGSVLKEADILYEDKNTRKIRPLELIDESRMRLVYSGYLKDYLLFEKKKGKSVFNI